MALPGTREINVGRRWIDLHLKAKHIWYRKLFILQTHLKAWGMILNSHQQIHTIRIATWQPQCLRPVPTITKTAFWPVPGCVAAAAPILASAEGKSIGLGFCVCLGDFCLCFVLSLTGRTPSWSCTELVNANTRSKAEV